MSIARGLVGWWRLDGNLTDSSGNGNHGTVGAGSAAYAAGVYGQAWDNDATRFVNLGNDSSLQITSKITLTAWIRLTTAAPVVGSTSEILSKFETSGNQRAYSIGITNDLKVQSRFSSAGTNPAEVTHTSDAGITLSTWHHVATTFDSGFRTLFLDGALIASRTETFTAIHNSTAPARVGVIFISGAAARHFIGQIDNPIIYNYALTASEIKTLYALGSPL